LLVNGVIAEHLIFKAIAMMLQPTHLDLDVAPAEQFNKVGRMKPQLLAPFTEDVEAGDFNISKQNAPYYLAHYTVKLTKTSRLFFLLLQQ
jgi:hypothetical protein